MNKYSHLSKGPEVRRELHKRIHKKGFLACAKKKTYDTEHAAGRWVSERGYWGMPYQCKHCHKWHTTSKGAKHATDS